MLEVIVELRMWDPDVAQAGHNLRVETGILLGTTDLGLDALEVRGHEAWGQINRDHKSLWSWDQWFITDFGNLREDKECGVLETEGEPEVKLGSKYSKIGGQRSQHPEFK